MLMSECKCQRSVWRLGLQQVNYEWWNLQRHEESDTWNEPSCILHPQLHSTFHTRYLPTVVSSPMGSAHLLVHQPSSSLLLEKSIRAECRSMQRSGIESQDTAMQCNAEQPAAYSSSLPHTGDPCTLQKERAQRSMRHVFLAPKMLVVFTKSDTSAQL